jgi:HNH endonuclease
MFDNGIIYLIEGNDIDRPRNAITLTNSLHDVFGNFDIFFEPPASDHPPHTYRISSLLPDGFLPDLPVTRTLYLSKSRTIDPPSPRLFALHRAIAHILHLSGAGDYIDKMFRDVEKNGIQANGSTELGRLVTLGLHGWLDGAVHT